MAFNANSHNVQWLGIIPMMIMLCGLTTTLAEQSLYFGNPKATNSLENFLMCNNFFGIFGIISLIILISEFFTFWRFEKDIQFITNIFMISIIIYFSIFSATFFAPTLLFISHHFVGRKFIQGFILLAFGTNLFHFCLVKTNRHHHAFAVLSRNKHLCRVMAICWQIKNAFVSRQCDYITRGIII